MTRTMLAALVALTLGPAAAQETPVAAEVLTGWRAEAGARIAGLRLRLAPGWKTYWRAPGDTGIPAVFDWSRSDNVQGVRVMWPAPKVYVVGGLTTIGYADEVVLPLEITPRDADRPVTLRVSVDLGVCKNICVPASLAFDAVMSGPGAPDAAISAALDARPLTGAEAGLSALACRVSPIADGLRVEARIDLPDTGSPEAVVIEPGQPGIWVAEAAVLRDGGVLTAVTEMVGPTAVPFDLDQAAMTVTVIGSDRAVEIAGCPAP